ncbi:MAG TPA: FliA/WhiG family RNA polymerase sigma factor [Planctomycetota bacterium]
MKRARPKAKAARSARSAKTRNGYVTTVLDKRVRRRLPSPVSAPLMVRKPAVEPAPEAAKGAETPQQLERAQAKAVRRRHEDTLWKAYFKTHNEDARNALWVHYQPLVRYISERLKSKLPECIDVCDLIGAGNVGLQDAITKFEPSVGVRFETYCVPRIRGAILDSIRALDWVPRLIRNKNHQYERIVRELAGQLRREPTEEEVATRLGMNREEFTELRKELNVRAQISVEGNNRESADDRDQMRLEMLEYRREVEPTRDLQREEIRDMALRGLNSNERMVVEQYYFNGRSMKQIGDELELSESRICQIHAQVLEVLRKKFRAYADSCHL